MLRLDLFLHKDHKEDSGQINCTEEPRHAVDCPTGRIEIGQYGGIELDVPKRIKGGIGNKYQSHHNGNRHHVDSEHGGPTTLPLEGQHPATLPYPATQDEKAAEPKGQAHGSRGPRPAAPAKEGGNN